MIIWNILRVSGSSSMSSTVNGFSDFIAFSLDTVM
jgi:hypothetical protein